jgi:hypothetical protein
MTARCRQRQLLVVSLTLLLLFLSKCLDAQESCSENGNGVCESVLVSQDTEINDNTSCGLYLAPSSIPNAGMGVFTTRPLQRGDLITPVGDVAIPIIGKFWHYGGKRKSDMFWPVKDYTWNPQKKGMQSEGGLEELKVEAYCPGLDALPNCHLALVNMDKTFPQHDYGGLHRSRDPGAGAFSPYHNGTSKVTSDVPAGAELFASYGDRWYV